MKELEPKNHELIKEREKAQVHVEELIKKRNERIVKLKEKLSYKQLSYYFKLSQTRIRQIIKRLRKRKD